MVRAHVQFQIPTRHRAALERAARERGVAVGAMVCEAIEVWDAARSVPEMGAALGAHPGASAGCRGPITPAHLAEVTRRAVEWWLGNPTLRSRQ